MTASAKASLGGTRCNNADTVVRITLPFPFSARSSILVRVSMRRLTSSGLGDTRS